MNIRPDRLREIADGAMGIGAPLVLTQAEQVAVCTELLACREQNARLVADMMALGQERSAACAERDAARAEAEKLTKRVQSMGSSMEHHVAAQTAKLTAELAAVKRQRDELLRIAKDDEFPSWDELAMRPEIDERFGTRVRILNAAARERHEDPDLSVRKFVFEASRLHVRNLGAACAELLKAAVENWRAEQPKPQQPEVQP